MKLIASRAVSRATSRATSRAVSREVSFAGSEHPDIDRLESTMSGISEASQVTLPGEKSRQERMIERLGYKSTADEEVTSLRVASERANSGSVRFDDKILEAGEPLSMKKREKDPSESGSSPSEADAAAKEAASQILSKLPKRAITSNYSNSGLSSEDDGRLTVIEAAMQKLSGWTSEAIVKVHSTIPFLLLPLLVFFLLLMLPTPRFEYESSHLSPSRFVSVCGCYIQAGGSGPGYHGGSKQGQ